MTVAARRWERLRVGALVSICCGFSSACTFEPGQGFATLESVRLSWSFEPGEARELGERVLTDRGYEVRVEALSLELDQMELVAESGTAGERFDPAHPPEGYSSCHGGHCHADDGRLVEESEIRVELAGGSVALVTIASLPVGRRLDLLAGEALRLTRVEPSRELPQALVSQIRLSLSRLRASAEVTGAELAEPVALEVELDRLPSVTVAAALDVSRDGPAVLRLDLQAVLDGTLFDGLDFAALALDGSARLSDPESPGGLRLSEAITNTSIHLEPR